MSERHTRQTDIEDLQQGKADDAQRSSNEAAVLHALRQLDPHADDGQQDYPSLLRRLQTALEAELSKWTATPS